jgi:DNA-binding PadR family transcriptional regulator
MHKDDLKKTIVEMLDTAKMHGYEIQKQLASRGFRPNISYLYRVLAEMETEGYLEGVRVKSALGPERKVYGLGKKGSEKLDQELKKAVKTIHVKYIQYLAKLPPEKSAIGKLQRLLDSQVSTGDTILVVAPKTFYDWMISSLCNHLEEGKIYLVKPQPVKLSIESANLILLDTPLENIPLKDNFVDAVRVHGEPENFRRALKEFHRVLRKDGSLAFIVPYFHPHVDSYPLTLGEFVEKVEHEVSEEDKTKLDYAFAGSLLSRYFRRVKRYRLAHLTIFVARGKI